MNNPAEANNPVEAKVTSADVEYEYVLDAREIAIIIKALHLLAVTEKLLNVENGETVTDLIKFFEEM